jgi:hypothetical protein
MNVKQIVDFLNNKRGYIKEGKRRLQQVLAKQGFKVTLNDCSEALRIVRSQMREEKEFREETMFNPNYSTEVAKKDELPDLNLKIKSAWQGANGKMLYSYTVDNKAENELQEFRQGLISDIISVNKHVLNRPKKKNTDNFGYVLEISLPDLHFGKGNIDELLNNFYNSLFDLTEKCKSLPLEKIILPIGNDGLNSEGFRQATTKGTPQHDTMPWFDSFRVYSKALMQAVDYLKTIAPVDVIVVQGNHDYERMFYVGEVISAYYMNDPNVTVDNSTESRKFASFGDVLIMYTHGDNEKHSELPIIMATERPMEFALAKHRETHCGHFHKEMIIDESRGIKTRFLPSICTTDEWHKKMGYSSYRAAQALLWHKDRGLEMILQHNI